MKSKTYIRVAILFIATVVIVFWGLNFLKGKNLLSSERVFYARYERIGGLTRSSPVTVNGFQIGQVRKIDLSEQNPDQIEVKFTISYKSINIPKGTLARIYSVDIMGTKGIALDFSDNPLMCNPNDTLTGSIEGDLRDQVNAQMLPLKMKAESLMSSMDSVLAGIQMVFSERNQNNLTESFSSVNHTLNNLESASHFLNQYVKDESQRISSLLSRVDTFSKSLQDQTDEFQGFISNMKTFSDTLITVPLATTVNSLQKVLENLNQLTGTLSEGEGTLGQLMMNDSLYTAVLATNASLNRLIEDIRLHPGKYIRLSLNDRSKSVYTANDSELARVLAGEGVSDYYICLLQSPDVLSPDKLSAQGFQTLPYIQVGSQFYYYTYHNKRIEPCLKRLDKIRKQHSSAGIFTWVSGSWKRLDL